MCLARRLDHISLMLLSQSLLAKCVEDHLAQLLPSEFHVDYNYIGTT